MKTKNPETLVDVIQRSLQKLVDGERAKLRADRERAAAAAEEVPGSESGPRGGR